jgi:hypothetical protein
VDYVNNKKYTDGDYITKCARTLEATFKEKWRSYDQSIAAKGASITLLALVHLKEDVVCRSPIVESIKSLATGQIPAVAIAVLAGNRYNNVQNDVYKGLPMTKFNAVWSIYPPVNWRPDNNNKNIIFHLYQWKFVHTGMINLLMLTEILQKNCYIWITCRWGKLASHFFTAL